MSVVYNVLRKPVAYKRIRGESQEKVFWNVRDYCFQLTLNFHGMLRCYDILSQIKVDQYSHMF